MKLKKIAGISFVSILIIITIAVIYFFFLAGDVLPDTAGTLTYTHLKAEVKVHRDKWGVPHIYAESDEDAYFALGYVMAQDRLWQMDFYRRITDGRLSEILPKNERILKFDKTFKLLCFRHYSKKSLTAFKTDPANKKIIKSMESYLKGVNTFIKENQNKLPVEFQILGYKPEPFTDLDIMTMAGYLAFGFNPTLKVEVMMGKLVNKLGKDKALEIFPDYHPDGKVTVDSKIHTEKSNSNNEKSALLQSYNGSLMSQLKINELLPLNLDGSNAWAISAKRSKSGKAILANDPHLPLFMPSIFYEAHIITKEQNFSGFFIPPIPFGLIGHNEDIGWAVTTLLNDSSDFYIEQIKKQGKDYFSLYQGKWEKAEILKQEIKFRDGSSEKWDTIITRHGPVVSGLYPGLKEKVALKWTFYDPKNWGVKAFYLLNHAKSKEDFKNALGYLLSPGINVVYADKENIGYYAAGAIPIRQNKEDGIIPMDGASGKYEWKGYVPFEEQVHQFNPEKGFIVSANNKIVGEDYPYYISRHWEPFDRANRITELIEKKEKISVEDCKEIQKDNKNYSAGYLLPYLFEAVKTAKLNKMEVEALNYLKKWDYHQTKESIAATIYNKWHFYVVREALKEKLGKEDFNEYCETRFPDKLLIHLFQKANSYWFDSLKTDKVESRDDIILIAFKKAVVRLKNKLGNDVSQWQWGKVHLLTIHHPFGVPLKWGNPLGVMVNLGPYPIAGGRQSVSKAQYPLDVTEKVIVGPAMRMIIDFNNLNDVSIINSTGQSGFFNHPHYKDQFELWFKNQYRQAFYEKETVKKESKDLLIFKP